MFCYLFVIVGHVQLFGSWRPTVKALVPPTPENLAENCNKFVEFLINVVKRIPTGVFSVCHNWCKNRAYQLFSLIHDPMKYLSHKFPKMESYQFWYFLVWTTPVSYLTQYFVHKDNPACRKYGLAHHVQNRVARFAMCCKCGKNRHFARMCKTQNIYRRSDVHTMKVVKKADCAMQTEKKEIGKENQTREKPDQSFR